MNATEEIKEYQKWCEEFGLDFKNLDNLEKFNNRMIVIEDYPAVIYGTHKRVGRYECKCPNCDQEYYCEYYYDFDKKEYKHNIKYCPNCGIRIISLKGDLENE